MERNTKSDPGLSRRVSRIRSRLLPHRRQRTFVVSFGLYRSAHGPRRSHSRVSLRDRVRPDFPPRGCGWGAAKLSGQWRVPYQSRVSRTAPVESAIRTLPSRRRHQPRRRWHSQFHPQSGAVVLPNASLPFRRQSRERRARTGARRNSRFAADLQPAESGQDLW